MLLAKVFISQRSLYGNVYTSAPRERVGSQGHCQPMLGSFGKAHMRQSYLRAEEEEDCVVSGGVEGKYNMKTNNGMAEGNDLW